MKLYSTTRGLVVDVGGLRLLSPSVTLDRIFSSPDPAGRVKRALAGSRPLKRLPPLRALVQSQEVWAAGVTYSRSRTARVAESKGTGGGSFYERVYDAVRPELFFKASAHRVAAPGGPVRIRRDSRWNVPEPELALAVSARGRIFGFTVANDMSSRDIEGENPLYLPQAKVYDGSAALGPCILLAKGLLPGTEISIEIRRKARLAFSGSTPLSRIKRSFEELVGFLFRDNSFPNGCLLMTGTGVVPPDGFTLRAGDVVSITIPGIGTLTNSVVRG